jgi:hypothetical protein
MSKSKSKAFRTLILLDQLFAVWIFNAHEDQTISGHVGYKAFALKSKKYLFLEKCINWLFSPWEQDHCYQSIEWDRIK